MKRLSAMVLLLALICIFGGCATQDNASAPEAATEINTWQGFYDLGIKCLSEENYQEAISAFESAISLDKTLADAYAGRGDAIIRSAETSENIEAALKDYQHALTLDDTNAAAYCGIADIHIRQGEYEEAISVLEKALEITNHDSTVAEWLDEFKSGLFYDSSYKLHRKLHYDGDGNLIGYTELDYDENGNELSASGFDAEGNSVGFVELSTVVNGNTTVITSYRENTYFNPASFSVTKSIITITKDSDGSSVHENISYDENSKSLGGSRSYYDSNSMCIRREDLWPNGNIGTYYTYKYDDQNNKIEQIEYLSDDTLHQRYVYEYNTDGACTRTEVYDGNGSLTSYSTFQYNEFGKVSRIDDIYVNGDGLNSSIIYLYDENGNEVGYERYDENGNLIHSTIYE